MRRIFTTMNHRKFIRFKNPVWIIFLLTLHFNPGFSQYSLEKEIDDALIHIDTLANDSLKLWKLFNLVGKNFRYAYETRRLLDRCHEMAKKTGDPIMLANYQYAMGNYFYYNSQLDSSEYYLEEALDLNAIKSDHFLHSQILSTQAGIQKINGQMSRSLETALQAKEILVKMDTLILRRNEKVKRIGQISILDNSIGTIYHTMEDYDMAINYYQRAYDLLMGLGDLQSAGAVMGNIGELYLYTASYNQSIEALELALEQKKTSEAPPRSIALTVFNMGRAFKSLGNLDTAMVEFNKAIRIFQQENSLRELASGYLERGLLWLDNGEYRLARQDCEKALELATSQSNVESRSEACKCLYFIHEKTGNYRASLEYYQDHVTLRDSIFNAENIKKLTRLEMEYNFNRERDLQQLGAEEKQREYQRSIRLLITAALVSMLIAFLFYYLFHQRRKANQLLADKNLEISKALSEKEVLLKEIHHRVKNNLQVISSLLSLQSRQLEDSKAKEAIRASRNRVKSMALIHQKLYQDENLVEVDVQEYIDKLTGSLVSSYQTSDKTVHFHTDVDSIKLDVDSIIPIGLILNELISNALKYAFDNDHSGTIGVSLKERNDGIRLEVSDDGLGLPDTFSIENSKGLGYRLIIAFAEKLKAHLSIEDLPRGTSVSMLIPYPKII